MGSSKKVTIGYWYLLAYHAGLTKGPIDALLEFRGGDKVAWKGLLTHSGTISINQPNLWGGEKDQGGIVGDVDVLFGEADQQPNDYLLATFGEQVSAWRGLATLVFKGGKYGAMNPYPQKASYKVRKILKGWDNDAPWYPEKAEIPLIDGYVLMLGAGWEYQVETFSEPNSGWNDFTVPTSGWLQGGELPFDTNGMSGGPYWTPTRSNIWLRRQIQVNSGGLTLNIGADNGCVVWINGVNVGSSNATNAPINSNENNPVSFALSETGLVEVVVKAFAEISASNEGGNVVSLAFTGASLIAMNPAHILYYSRTNSEMGREPIERINDASLRAAADWFHAQGFGLCTRWDSSVESPVDFEQRICKVAGCAFTRSLIDGQWYVDIANGEYDIDALPILTDDDILEFKETPSILDNAVNSAAVKYFDPITKENITTASARALGLIAAFGTIEQVADFPEIPTPSLASRVAARELLATATPTRAFELITTRKTYAWRPNQYFRLQSPKRGIADMVCIVGELLTGKLRSGAIQLRAVQDIYGLPDSVYIEYEPGVDTAPSQTPAPITTQRVFEAPYIEVATSLSRADLEVLPEETGFLVGVAIDPASSLDYTMCVSPDEVVYDEVAHGEWCPSALIVEEADRRDTEFTFTGGIGLDQIVVGMPVLWGDEICRVDAIDSGAGTITLGRGCADTVPARHDAGSRLWFYTEGAASDPTEYTDGETIQAKLLTNTGSQQLAESAAMPLPLTFGQRQARPYPPADVKINGTYYPASAVGPTALSATWVDRNRVLQADQLVDTTMGTIAAEPGTTYTLRGYEDGVLMHTESGITGAVTDWTPSETSTVRIELESEIDGLVSWQYWWHEMEWTASLSDDEMAQNILGKLAHWWPLDESAGPYFHDAHGGMDLTWFSAGSGVTFSRPTVRSGGASCVQFTGNGGAFVWGQPEWLLRGIDISVVAWSKMLEGGYASTRPMIADAPQSDSSESLNYRIYWGVTSSSDANPTRVTASWEYGVGTDVASLASTTMDTSAHMHAATRKNALSRMSFYRDGANDGVSTYAHEPTGGDSIGKYFALGNIATTTAGSTSSNGTAVRADMQDVAVFRTPLNDDEIAWLYNAGAGRSYANLWTLSTLTRLWTPAELRKKVVWIKSDHVDNGESTAGYINRLANLTGFPAGLPYADSLTNQFRNNVSTLNGRKVLTGNGTTNCNGHFYFPNSRYRWSAVGGSTIVFVGRPVVAETSAATAKVQVVQARDGGTVGHQHSVYRNTSLNSVSNGGRRIAGDTYAQVNDSTARTGWDIIGGYTDFSAGNAGLKINGDTATTVTGLTTGVTSTGARSNDLGLGGSAYSTAERSLNSEFAEVIVLDGLLTSTEWQKLEGYLAHAWGLTSNLPSGHPYKSSAPTV